MTDALALADAWKLVKAVQQLKAENDNEAAQITALRDEAAELRREPRARSQHMNAGPQC
jgi:cell division protein FtsB